MTKELSQLFEYLTYNFHSPTLTEYAQAAWNSLQGSDTFEVWARKHNLDLRKVVDGRRYESMETEWAFQAWRTPDPRVAELEAQIESMKDVFTPERCRVCNKPLRRHSTGNYYHRDRYYNHKPTL